MNLDLQGSNHARIALRVLEGFPKRSLKYGWDSVFSTQGSFPIEKICSVDSFGQVSFSLREVFQYRVKPLVEEDGRTSDVRSFIVILCISYGIKQVGKLVRKFVGAIFLGWK